MPARRASSHEPGPLSARESTIAELVMQGFTNGEIAERLSISIKTVEKHLASIFAKLEIHSRAQIAAFVARERREPEFAAQLGR